MNNSVSLVEVLESRDARVAEQTRILAEYGMPIVSFTVNMPGPVKLCENSRFIHKKGMEQLTKALAEHGLRVIWQTVREKKTGLEGFLSVDTQPETLKKITCQLEDGSPLGRLYDMDVLSPDGRQVSRENLGMPRRKCLICEKESAVCARSRAHSVAELLKKIEEIVSEERQIADTD